MADLTNQGTAGPVIDAVTTGMTVQRRGDGVFEVNDDASVAGNGVLTPTDPAFSLSATDSCTLLWVGQLDAVADFFASFITVGTTLRPLNLSTPALAVPGDEFVRVPLAAGGRQLIVPRLEAT